MLTHGLRRRRAILRQQWVGNSVGEKRIWLMKHLDELHRHLALPEASFQRIHHMPGCAVAGIHHQFKWP